MNIAPYLDILVKNDKIFEALKNKYPEILADLTSSKFNPSCSCRGRVAAFLNKKYQEEDKDFLQFILSLEEIKNEKLKIDQALKEQESRGVDITQQILDNSTNHIYQVPKGPKGWEDFNKFVKEKAIVFRGFSIVEKDNYLEVYFL